jgi:hypothetical protein
LFNSLESYFNERSPWTVGTVKLDCGPVLVTHIAMSCYGRDMRVQVMLAHDDGGSTVLVAVPAESAADGIGEDKSVAELMALE